MRERLDRAVLFVCALMVDSLVFDAILLISDAHCCLLRLEQGCWRRGVGYEPVVFSTETDVADSERDGEFSRFVAWGFCIFSHS